MKKAYTLRVWRVWSVREALPCGGFWKKNDTNLNSWTHLKDVSCGWGENSVLLKLLDLFVKELASMCGPIIWWSNRHKRASKLKSVYVCLCTHTCKHIQTKNKINWKRRKNKT